MKLADGGFWPIANGHLVAQMSGYWARRGMHTSVALRGAARRMVYRWIAAPFTT
jgi:hypothetical protein